MATIRISLQIAIDDICSFCNTLEMSSSATLPEDPELRAAVIADAATRLKMLQRLGDLGMRLAEDVVERAVTSPYHPEPRHEPARAFANVSRSVRLTLVLQEKMEARLIALRNGAALFPGAGAAARAKGGGERPVEPDDVRDDRIDGADSSRETLRERESERFDELLSGPFEDCVAAIRADLGLKPGEDVPSDGEGVEAALETVLEAARAAPVGRRAVFDSISPAAIGATWPRPPDSG